MRFITTLAAAAALSSAAFAQDEDEPHFLGGNFSASVAFTTDYTFRGISQSSTDAAVQGSIDWASDLFYAGIWGSTVDFNDEIVNPFTGEQENDGASVELDFYVGYTPSLGPVGVTVQALYYLYPGAPQDGDDIFVPEPSPDLLIDPIEAGLTPGDVFFESFQQDYFELSLGFDYTAFGFLDLGITSAWSPEYYFEAGDSLHTEISVGIPLGSINVFGQDISFVASGSAAYLEFFDDADADESSFEDYIHYGVGVTASVLGFDLDGRFIATDALDPDIVGSFLDGNPSTGVFTISRSF